MLALASEDEQESADLGPWLALQDWLETGERQVTVPYAKRLAMAIPPVAVRLRRDFSTILGLIRAHALLHRARRETDDRGRIVATIEDYAVVRELMLGLISDGVGATVRPETRETVGAVAELLETHPDGVRQRAVAELLGLDKGATSRRVRVALDGGYIVNLEERRGRPHRLARAIRSQTTSRSCPLPRSCTVARLHRGVGVRLPELRASSRRMAAKPAEDDSGLPTRTASSSAQSAGGPWHERRHPHRRAARG
jgi:hypothetical protein